MRRGIAPCQQELLTVYGFADLARCLGYIRAAREHSPRFHIVRQVDRQDLVANAPHQGRVVEWEKHLHSLVDVARHQVRAADIDLFLTAVAEVVNPAMLKEPAHDAHDFNVIADAGHPRAQAADAPHQELDFHPRLGGAIEGANQRHVHQGIHLENEMPFSAGPGV